MQSYEERWVKKTTVPRPTSVPALASLGYPNTSQHAPSDSFHLSSTRKETRGDWTTHGCSAGHKTAWCSLEEVLDSNNTAGFALWQPRTICPSSFSCIVLAAKHWKMLLIELFQEIAGRKKQTCHAKQADSSLQSSMGPSFLSHLAAPFEGTVLARWPQLCLQLRRGICRVLLEWDCPPQTPCFELCSCCMTASQHLGFFSPLGSLGCRNHRRSAACTKTESQSDCLCVKLPVLQGDRDGLKAQQRSSDEQCEQYCFLLKQPESLLRTKRRKDNKRNVWFIAKSSVRACDHEMNICATDFSCTGLQGWEQIFIFHLPSQTLSVNYYCDFSCCSVPPNSK